METRIVNDRARLKRPRTKRESACDYCRAKKIRCNRVTFDTCANCLDRNLSCTAVGLSNTDAGTGSEADTSFSDATLIQVQQQATQTCRTTGLLTFSVAAQPAAVSHTRQNPSQNHNFATPDADLLARTEATRPPVAQGYILSPPTTQHGLSDGSVDGAVSQRTNDVRSVADLPAASLSQLPEPTEDSCLSSNESTNWEYHGPRSCLSLCSLSGVEWVESKTDSSTYRQLAQKFTNDITRRLKLSNDLPRTDVPELDRATALKYTAAYFRNALDASMGIVHRLTFEKQLTDHLDGKSSDMELAWHTLRYAIYASGCRIFLSETETFQASNQTAWAYFEIALSLHTKTLLFKTSLTSVQALTVMAYFTQNFGSPCLEYMLCNNALTLALSKGLHRTPRHGYNLTEADRLQRYCLFWAIYCLDKQIEKQSGRPSAINDDEITCEIPETSSLSGDLDLTYLSTMVKLSRFASTVSRRLSSVQVLRLDSQTLIMLVMDLDRQLKVLKTQLRPTIALGTCLKPNHLPTDLTLQQAVYVHCLYHTTELDIHNTLIYPWSQGLLRSYAHPLVSMQLAASIDEVIKSCHTALLTLNYVHIDSATPVPLSFFTPVCVLTSLFVCILQNPMHDHVSLALSLMEMGAAFFTRLHLATDSEVPMSYAWGLTALARDAIRKAPMSTSRTISSNVNNRTTSDVEDQAARTCSYGQPYIMGHSGETDAFREGELIMERWSTFIPGEFDLDGIDFREPMAPGNGRSLF